MGVDGRRCAGCLALWCVLGGMGVFVEKMSGERRERWRSINTRWAIALKSERAPRECRIQAGKPGRESTRMLYVEDDLWVVDEVEWTEGAKT